MADRSFVMGPVAGNYYIVVQDGFHMVGTLPIANEVLKIQVLSGNEHVFSMTAKMPSGPGEV